MRKSHNNQRYYAMADLKFLIMKQEEIEEIGTLSKAFKLQTFDASEKVKDAKLEKLKEEMGLDDTGKFLLTIILHTVEL